MAAEIPASPTCALPSAVQPGWTPRSLASLCEFVRDGDWIETKDQGGTEFRLLQISNIGTGSFVETGKFRWISRETFHRLGCTEVQASDVLVARMPEPTGRAWFVSSLPWRAVTAVDVAIIRTKPVELDPEFLAYVLNSPKQLAFSRSLTTGTTRMRLRRADLEGLSLLVPPIEEQRAIARTLGPLDERIELSRRTAAALESIAQALFNDWFVQFGPVRAKAQGNLPAGMDAALAALFPGAFSESEWGPIPSGWRIAQLGDLVSLQRGTTYKSGLKGKPGPCLLGLGSIMRNGGFRGEKLVSYGGDSPPKMLLRPGDLFVSLKDVTQSADLLGAVARVPPSVELGRLTQDTVKLELSSNQRDAAKILYRALLTPGYREYCRAHATGTTNLGLSREDFLSYPICLPDDSLLVAFNALMGAIENRIDVAREEAAALAQLRDELLPRLVSGELRVADFRQPAGQVA